MVWNILSQPQKKKLENQICQRTRTKLVLVTRLLGRKSCVWASRTIIKEKVPERSSLLEQWLSHINCIQFDHYSLKATLLAFPPLLWGNRYLWRRAEYLTLTLLLRSKCGWKYTRTSLEGWQWEKREVQKCSPG